MSKKLKLLTIAILTILAAIFLTSAVYAWSPANQTPIFPQSDRYFCKQKGGAVRFTQFDPGYYQKVNGVTNMCEQLYDTFAPGIRLGIQVQMVGILERLRDYAKPIPSNSVQLRWYNGIFTNDGNSVYISGNTVYGPKTAMTPVLNATGTYNPVNTRTAYTLSAGPEVSPLALGFKKGNYKKTVSDTADSSAIQDSLWNDPTFNEGTILGGSALYAEALAYENFYKANDLGNFKASINTGNAQVIANRDEKTFIIGPYSVKYPDDPRFSYIEDLYVITDKSSRVEPIEILFASKSSEKPYPSTGETFFVKFSAEGDPKEAGIHIDFAHIQTSEATYNTLEGKGDIYQFIGELKTRTVGGHHHEVIEEEEHTDPKTGETYTEEVDNGYNDNLYDIWGEITLKKVGEYKAQKDIERTDHKRVWQRELLETSMSIGGGSSTGNKLPPSGSPEDLTMELGGFVWEDADAGKESVQDGNYAQSERRIPNVIVTLYREGGAEMGSTKTDGNGEYRFTNLDAMYQYYVKFTYNGQYYQPTTYASSSTWGASDWPTNSNATDKKTERVSFNAKFASIGSSPENYFGKAGGNQTYTKEELLSAGAIDEFGNASNGGNDSMKQYVQDCMMDAYTGNGDGSYDLYPVPSVFVIDTFQYPSGLTPKADILYPNAYYINLGLNPREESDLAIKKDVDHVTLEINGQKHTYTYDTLEHKPDADEAWDISVRLSDSYYTTRYSRELYKSDYIYKASMYGDDEKLKELGKSKADELEVYITYKIMIRNQALSIRARVDELVDYYDEDLEYVDERSYIEIKQSRDNAAQKGIYSAKANSNTKYASKTVIDMKGYDNLYITGLGSMSSNEKENYLAAGQTAYVYLTFKVKKDTRDGEDWVRLDEQIESGNAIGVGKENIVEVNGYSTQYAKGTTVPNVGDVSFNPAGIVDRDSNSGNLSPSDVPKDGNINYGNFEDDTDKAPNIRIILYRDDEANRVISGTVWEDERTESIDVTTTGDGIRDSKDSTQINGVTVQLVELMENGTEYVWREFGDNNAKNGELGGQTTIGKGSGSGTVASETPIMNAYNLVKNYDFANEHNGQYAFKSFMPGKYVVRFIYGDTTRTVVPRSLGGLNEKSYNGQDYKSTTYQEGITQNKVYTWREDSTWNLGQEILGKELTQVSTFKSDASNNETTKATLSATEQKGYLYDITASDSKNNVSDAKDIESRRDQVVDYSDNDVTNYIAEVLASHKADYTTMNERDQLLKDLMSNTQMTAETGLMVIELEYDRTGTPNQTQNNTASYKIQNVDLGLEERPKAQLVIDKEVTNAKLTLADGSILFDAQNKETNVLWRDHKPYEVGYKGNVMDPEKFGSLQNIRNKNASKFGLIQLTMDEELMHGATIEITYKVTMTNVGEVDYDDNPFYYTGNKSNNAKVVTTRADQVIDYVANNLQFNASNNSKWHVISKDDIKTQGLVNSKLDSQVDKYNTVIATEALNTDLVPSLYKDKVKAGEDSVSVPLVLTQLITSENDTDDLTYRNLVEIVKTSNTVGRRMEYSVVGNQDPEAAPQELDSDIAEVVRILPPFGSAVNYLAIIGISLLAVVLATGGIIFIKRKKFTK